MNEQNILRLINRLLPFGLSVIRWHRGRKHPDNESLVFIIERSGQYTHCVFNNGLFVSSADGRLIADPKRWHYDID